MSGSASSGVEGPGGSASESDTSVLLDVAGDDGAGPGMCRPIEGMRDINDCVDKAPPDSFDPVVQWEWWGPDGEEQVSTIPLVGSFTDDNGDGEIDACDVPDVLVVASPHYLDPGHIYLLDGATGALHRRFAEPVESKTTAAFGDIDGDGLPEVISRAPDVQTDVLAFEHDGTLKWRTHSPDPRTCIGVALADLDNDGDVEIIFGDAVFDHDGELLWWVDTQGPAGLRWCNHAPTAADLDGDGDLEVVRENAAFHHDGTLYYEVAEVTHLGFPQVADLDDDPEPEVLVTSSEGLTMLEHDGTVKFHSWRPTGDPEGKPWHRPATVHDFNGDGLSDYAASSGLHYSAFERSGTLLWTIDVAETSCCSAGTAFDFLGDSIAEAMYADEYSMFVVDGKSGSIEVSTDRSSWTSMEYPVVADVDRDGSAEVVVVSSRRIPSDPQTAATVQVIRDREDRWVPARGIWNQHTYHVTNVRDDGTIPAVEPRSWETLNTFRTQAQVDDDGLCRPPLEG